LPRVRPPLRLIADGCEFDRELILKAPAPWSRGKALTMPSRAYRLHSGEGAADGIRRIAAGRAERALERLGDVGGSGFAGTIHGARKDLKKLRAVLRLIRVGLGKKEFEIEDRRYRKAGRLLSRSRDAEVKLKTLVALRERHEGQLLSNPTARWIEALEAERDELAAALHGPSNGEIAIATETIEAGREAIHGWSLSRDSWDLIGPGLTGSYREGRRAMKRVLVSPSATDVHEWRKREKDLWYQLRILREAWPAVLGETIGQAEELGRLLGHHHDLTVLGVDLRRRADLGDLRPFEIAISKEQEKLLETTLEVGRRLYVEKPKAFRRRIGGYWLAWRGA
jgi:CHAD domain-containing protein